MNHGRKVSLKFVLGTIIAITVGVLLIYGLCNFGNWLGHEDAALAESIETNKTYEIVPEMVRVSDHKNGEWSYYVDKRTNYTYLVYESYYKRAVTAMLNPDGTPMTLEQLLNSR